MRVGLTADFHGVLPDVPPCDLLLVAGDIHGVTDRWLRDVPAAEIVGVAGNHDYDAQEIYGHLPWHYLQDSGVELLGFKIWGSPWSKLFGGWEFMLPDDQLADRWALIPDDTQILVVHGPPYGHGDLAQGRLPEGSKTLLARIDQLADLRLAVFGHIHEGFGQYPTERCAVCGRRVDLRICPAPCDTPMRPKKNRVPGPLLVNASQMDERYRPVNQPVVITIEGTG